MARRSHIRRSSRLHSTRWASRRAKPRWWATRRRTTSRARGRSGCARSSSTGTTGFRKSKTASPICARCRRLSVSAAGRLGRTAEPEAPDPFVDDVERRDRPPAPERQDRICATVDPGKQRAVEPGDASRWVVDPQPAVGVPALRAPDGEEGGDTAPPEGDARALRVPRAVVEVPGLLPAVRGTRRTVSPRRFPLVLAWLPARGRRGACPGSRRRLSAARRLRSQSRTGPPKRPEALA
jgi:hypothetical protein